MTNFFKKIFGFINNFRMKDDFEKALKFTLRWEGGYVNDPNDPGGETKYGISKRSYPLLDIKNLTFKKAKEIFKKDFWIKSNANTLPWPINLVQFDCAVNLGTNRAQRFLKEVGSDDNKLIIKRELFYINLATKRPAFKKYINGWLNRTDALRAYIKESKNV